MNLIQPDLLVKGNLHLDGKFYRCPTTDKPKSLNGWYIGNPNGWLTYGNFRTGEQNTININADPVPLKSVKNNSSVNSISSNSSIVRQSSLCVDISKKIQGMWDSAQTCVNHPYLTKKGVKSYGLRMYHDLLLVPLHDMNGKLSSLQMIQHDGQKRFIKGGKVKGHYYTIGSLHQSLRVYICEGYATAATIYEATQTPVIATMSANNIGVVAESIRKKYPEIEIRICADNDQYTLINGVHANPGVTYAQEAAIQCQGTVMIPKFKNTSSEPTDFNDLMGLEGISEVRRQVEYGPAIQRIILQDGLYLSDIAEKLLGIIDRFTKILIVAETGLGKTTFLRDIISKYYSNRMHILAAPTIALAEQKAYIQPQDPNDQAIHYHVVKGGTYANTDRIQFTTYNSIKKFSKDQISSAIGLVDEIHQMPISMGYRAQAMHYLKDTIDQCWKQIYVTSTPLPYLEYIQPEVIIQIISPKKPIQMVEIKTDHRYKSIQALHIKGQTTCVYLQKKDDADVCATYLKQHDPSANIAIINADVKDSKAYSQIIAKNTIDSNIDYMLMTTYLSEGVDIKEHQVANFIFADYCSQHAIKQFLSRFRTHRPHHFYYFKIHKPIDKDLNLTPIYNHAIAQKHRDQYRTAADLLLRTYEELHQANRIDFQHVRDLLLGNPEFCIYQNSEQQMQRDDLMIEYFVYRHYDTCCQQNRDYFYQELKRYDIHISETRNMIFESCLKDDVEYQDSKNHAQTLREDAIKAKLWEVSQYTEDQILFAMNEHPIKRKVRLLYEVCRDLELAIKIMSVVKNNERRFQTALIQLKIRECLKHEQHDDVFESILNLKKDQAYSLDIMYAAVKKICASAKDLSILTDILKDTLDELTPHRAMQIVRYFYIVLRRRMKDAQNNRINVYFLSRKPIVSQYNIDLSQYFKHLRNEINNVTQNEGSDKIGNSISTLTHFSQDFTNKSEKSESIGNTISQNSEIVTITLLERSQDQNLQLSQAFMEIGNVTSDLTHFLDKSSNKSTKSESTQIVNSTSSSSDTLTTTAIVKQYTTDSSIVGKNNDYQADIRIPEIASLTEQDINDRVINELTHISDYDSHNDEKSESMLYLAFQILQYERIIRKREIDKFLLCWLYHIVIFRSIRNFRIAQRICYNNSG